MILPAVLAKNVKKNPKQINPPHPNKNPQTNKTKNPQTHPVLITDSCLSLK